MSERIEVKQLSAIGNEVGEIASGTLHDVPIAPPSGHTFAKDLKVEFRMQALHGYTESLRRFVESVNSTTDSMGRFRIPSHMVLSEPFQPPWIMTPDARWPFRRNLRAFYSQQRRAVPRRLRTSYPGLTPAQAQRLACYAQKRGVV